MKFNSLVVGRYIGTYKLHLAKVLTGDSFESAPDSTLRMPPEKPRNQKAGNIQLKQLRYDSVTGITYDCRVYMTYSNDKAPRVEM